MWLDELLPKAFLLVCGTSDLCLIRNIELFWCIYKQTLNAQVFFSDIHVPVSAVVSVAYGKLV